MFLHIINILSIPHKQGETLLKGLGGNIGYKDKNSSWPLIGFPHGSGII